MFNFRSCPISHSFNATSVQPQAISLSLTYINIRHDCKLPGVAQYAQRTFARIDFTYSAHMTAQDFCILRVTKIP
jgi:hypothetical protein